MVRVAPFFDLRCTLQSIVILTTAIFIPVYLFIARQSRDRMSGLTTCQAVNQQTCQIPLRNAQNFNRLYLRHFLNGFTSGFQHNNLLVPGYKVIYNRKCPARFHSEIPN